MLSIKISKKGKKKRKINLITNHTCFLNMKNSHQKFVIKKYKRPSLRRNVILKLTNFNPEFSVSFITLLTKKNESGSQTLKKNKNILLFLLFFLRNIITLSQKHRRFLKNLSTIVLFFFSWRFRKTLILLKEEKRAHRDYKRREEREFN